MAGNDELVIEGQKTHLSRGAALKILTWLVILGLAVTGLTTVLELFFDITKTPLFAAITDNSIQSLIYYLIFTVVATVLVPLPTLPIDVVLIKIFNPWVILLFRLLGDLIGTAIAYGLARRFGKPLVRRWFSRKNAEEIIAISESVSWKQFFWIAMFPLVNTELVAYAAGLSRLKLVTLIWIIAVAITYRLLIVLLFAI